MEWVLVLLGLLMAFLAFAVPLALLALLVYIIWNRVEEKRKENFEQRNH